MSRPLDHSSLASEAPVSRAPLRIYTGILGQIGDIVMFTATVRRLRELFPRAEITFAVSRKYREAGELVAGLPYIDRLFVTEHYFERLTPPLIPLWEKGWPVELRGEDEVAQQRQHDLVFETRPRHPRARWWEYAHQVAECAYEIGVPGPIDLRTEIQIPARSVIPEAARAKVVIHNDPAIDARKAWPWAAVAELVQLLSPDQAVLLGNPGPTIPGVLDLRGQTTLAQAAAVIQAARCYVGIDSGLMWIAGSLQVPAVGLYGTSYIPAYEAIQPVNPNAVYLQAEGPLDLISPEIVLKWVRHAIDRTAAGAHPALRDVRIAPTPAARRGSPDG
jgi:ADP-heptose:LPS heptosyltransferase